MFINKSVKVLQFFVINSEFKRKTILYKDLFDYVYDFELYFQKIPNSLLALQLITLANSYNILYLVPFPAPSHWFWLKNFSEELLNQGHSVSNFWCKPSKFIRIKHICLISGHYHHKLQTIRASCELY